jgi:hypothetical protein
LLPGADSASVDPANRLALMAVMSSVFFIG